MSHRAIADRLLAEHKIKVSHVAVGKQIAKASAATDGLPPLPRAASPSPAPPTSSSPLQPASPSSSPDPAAEPDDTAETVRVLRKLRRQFARQALRRDATALDQQRSAQTLLLVIAELRKAVPPPPPETTSTAHDDAIEVRKRLEKMRASAAAQTS